MNQSSAEVELDGVTKSFGSRTVLYDLNLTIRGGELLSVLGASGCGKTTALRVIAGFEHPEYGRVRIDGVDVTRRSTAKRGIGIVFQAYSLFPHMTARENVMEAPVQVRGLRRAEARARADELLERVGLSDRADHYPAQLSGGQQQRVALARAFGIEPRVLLLDEPLSALDAKVRVQLREEIRRLQSEMGTTTVMVTHDQEEALTMADRVAVMREGRIEQLGSPDEVYRTPVNPFVASFVGNVNRMPARVVAPGRVAVLGAELTAETGAHAAGDAVEVLVRPEAVGVRAVPDGVGTVSAVVLRGPITSVQVDLGPGAAPVRIDLPTSAGLRFAAGERVGLDLSEQWVLVDGPAGVAPDPGPAAASDAVAVA